MHQLSHRAHVSLRDWAKRQTLTTTKGERTVWHVVEVLDCATRFVIRRDYDSPTTLRLTLRQFQQLVRMGQLVLAGQHVKTRPVNELTLPR